MSLRNKASRVFLASLVFFILCQVSHQLLGNPSVCNTGIGLGIQISPTLLVAIIVLTLTLALFLFRDILHNTEKLTLAVLFGNSLLFGGALSNIVDRFHKGCVPDFFPIGWFPAFNVADIGISVGATILLILILRNREREELKQENSK